jgi:hypothetical protein
MAVPRRGINRRRSAVDLAGTLASFVQNRCTGDASEASGQTLNCGW